MKSDASNIALFAASVILLGLISLFPARTGDTNNSTNVFGAVSDSVSAISSPALEISARSALATDLTTGDILFEKNKIETLPLASLTKIISVLVASDELSSDGVVRISTSAIATDGTSSLRAGEHLFARDLMAMAMVESSNDAISALMEHTAAKNDIEPANAEAWFIQKMREKALSLGALTMTFSNATGLDASKERASNFGSAEDLMQIAQRTYASDIWRHSSDQRIVSAEGYVHRLNPTNTLEGEIVQLMGSKTGFTDIAGGNLLVLFEFPINHPVGIIVLGSTETGRFEDIQKIISYSTDLIRTRLEHTDRNRIQ